jgi:hypothetical protein
MESVVIATLPSKICSLAGEAGDLDQVMGEDSIVLNDARYEDVGKRCVVRVEWDLAGWDRCLRVVVCDDNVSGSG